MDNSRTKTPPAAPAEPAREGGGEGFVGRWSRLKAEARERSAEQPQATPGPADPQAPPPDLPPPERLTFDSDYRQFLHPKVGEEVRRAALKKLFSDPRFNVMDGLDVYVDDYSKTEPIPAAMLAGLKQAQNIFQWAKEDAEERRKAEENAVRQTDAGQATLEPPETRSDSSGRLEVKATELAPVRTSAADESTRS